MHAYPDETVRTSRIHLKIVKLSVIVHGLVMQNLADLEQWALSDNGASEALGNQRAAKAWEITRE